MNNSNAAKNSRWKTFGEGTGRFENATGTLQFDGAAQGNAGFFSLAGTVYVTSADDQ